MKTINTSTAAEIALNGTLEEQNKFSQKMTTELEELFGITDTKDKVEGLLAYKRPISLMSEMDKAEDYFEAHAA